MQQALKCPARRAWIWAIAMGIEKKKKKVIFERNTNRIWMKKRIFPCCYEKLKFK